MQPTIYTLNGSYFNFLDVEKNVISISTIARALSNLCRFNGQIEQFYSVAQHSVLCSYLVPKDLAMQALFHDAAEAYIGDVTKPLKSLLPAYKEIEQRVEFDIFKKLGLEWPLHPLVKEADLIMLATERRDLFNPNNATGEWSILKNVEASIDIHITPVFPNDAYLSFISRYWELKGAN